MWFYCHIKLFYYLCFRLLATLVGEGLTPLLNEVSQTGKNDQMPKRVRDVARLTLESFIFAIKHQQGDFTFVLLGAPEVLV